MTRILPCYICDRKRMSEDLALIQKRSAVFPYPMEEVRACVESCAKLYTSAGVMRPCECCGQRQALPMSLDCLECTIEVDMYLAQTEMRLMA